ncbi:hypothetical protein E2562_028034 [Oryza meyeriana var. granulata]|uniref:Uncharacterized protein n=1 Tax=Oryza meyeriana var. granulata TaxID=110450 RepID=A0A6G1C0A8_9ORYZ|nr:hypothetical protein E2562_028034 [Oryza meyeriana var. granulata]
MAGLEWEIEARMSSRLAKRHRVNEVARWSGDTLSCGGRHTCTSQAAASPFRRFVSRQRGCIAASLSSYPIHCD